MKTLLLLLSYSLACFAQAGTLGPVCPATVKVPGNLVCTAVLSGGSLPAVLAGTITTSQTTGPITVAVTGTAITAAKSATANVSNWLLWGVNANTIADGTVLTITIPLTTANGCSGNSPCFTVSFSGIAAASVAAILIPEIANPPASVFAYLGCDVNKDGQISQADVTTAINNFLVRPQIAMDLDGDGATTPADVQIVINAARGLACTAL